MWAVSNMGVFFVRMDSTTAYLYTDEPIYPFRGEKLMKLEKDNVELSPFIKGECGIWSFSFILE